MGLESASSLLQMISPEHLFPGRQIRAQNAKVSRGKETRDASWVSEMHCTNSVRLNTLSSDGSTIWDMGHVGSSSSLVGGTLRVTPLSGPGLHPPLLACHQDVRSVCYQPLPTHTCTHVWKASIYIHACSQYQLLPNLP